MNEEKIAALQAQNQHLLSLNAELVAALKNARHFCACSVAERDSGHHVDCYVPEWEAIIAKAQLDYITCTYCKQK